MGSRKTIVGAAGLAAALGVGGVLGSAFGAPGISGALQTEDGTTTETTETTESPRRPFGEHLAVAAELLGMTTEELATALRDGATVASLAEERGVEAADIVEALVADSEDEHVERVTDFVNGEYRGHGPAGPGRGFRTEGLEAAATAIGISVEDLRSALQEDDATIASVAEANGVDVQAVIDAMVADATAEIDEAVAAGRIDAERAEEIKTNLPERITDVVNGAFEGHGPGGFGGHGRPGGRGAVPEESVPDGTGS